MTRSDHYPKDAGIEGQATGYTRTSPGAVIGPDGRGPRSPLVGRGSSAGGGYSTVGDLVRYAHALRDGKLLDAEHSRRAFGGPRPGLGIGAILSAVWRYALAAPVASASSTAIIQRIPALVTAPGLLGAVDRGAIASVLFTSLYLAAIVVLHGGKAPLLQVGVLLRDMLPRPSHHPDVPPPLVTSG